MPAVSANRLELLQIAEAVATGLDFCGTGPDRAEVLFPLIKVVDDDVEHDIGVALAKRPSRGAIRRLAAMPRVLIRSVPAARAPVPSLRASPALAAPAQRLLAEDGGDEAGGEFDHVVGVIVGMRPHIGVSGRGAASP